MPYVYTEQGVAMLSGVLKNEMAIQVSINIIRAFIEMRKFLVSNGQVFERLTNVECKLLEQDKKIDNLFAKFDQEDKVTQKLLKLINFMIGLLLLITKNYIIVELR